MRNLYQLRDHKGPLLPPRRERRRWVLVEKRLIKRLVRLHCLSEEGERTEASALRDFLKENKGPFFSPKGGDNSRIAHRFIYLTYSRCGVEIAEAKRQLKEKLTDKKNPVKIVYMKIGRERHKTEGKPGESLFHLHVLIEVHPRLETSRKDFFNLKRDVTLQGPGECFKPYILFPTSLLKLEEYIGKEGGADVEGVLTVLPSEGTEEEPGKLPGASKAFGGIPGSNLAVIMHFAKYGMSVDSFAALASSGFALERVYKAFRAMAYFPLHSPKGFPPIPMEERKGAISPESLQHVIEQVSHMRNPIFDSDKTFAQQTMGISILLSKTYGDFTVDQMGVFPESLQFKMTIILSLLRKVGILPKEGAEDNEDVDETNVPMIGLLGKASVYQKAGETVLNTPIKSHKVYLRRSVTKKKVLSETLSLISLPTPPSLPRKRKRRFVNKKRLFSREKVGVRESLMRWNLYRIEGAPTRESPLLETSVESDDCKSYFFSPWYYPTDSWSSLILKEAEGPEPIWLPAFFHEKSAVESGVKRSVSQPAPLNPPVEGKRKREPWFIVLQGYHTILPKECTPLIKGDTVLNLMRGAFHELFEGLIMYPHQKWTYKKGEETKEESWEVFPSSEFLYFWPRALIGKRVFCLAAEVCFLREGEEILEDLEQRQESFLHNLNCAQRDFLMWSFYGGGKTPFPSPSTLTALKQHARFWPEETRKKLGKYASYLAKWSSKYPKMKNTYEKPFAFDSLTASKGLDSSDESKDPLERVEETTPFSLAASSPASQNGAETGVALSAPVGEQSVVALSFASETSVALPSPEREVATALPSVAEASVAAPSSPANGLLPSSASQSEVGA